MLLCYQRLSVCLRLNARLCSFVVHSSDDQREVKAGIFGFVTVIVLIVKQESTWGNVVWQQ
jgi:hypothetical protein